MFNRREFIKTSISGGMLLGFGFGLGACSGIKREATTGGPKEDPATLPLTYLQREILYLASLAPSSHNTQPWQVRATSSDTWIVEADSRGKLPVVDPRNRELLLSIGAFVENLCLAAGCLGLNAHTQVIAKTAMERDLVRITLQRDAPRNYSLERIRRRRTIKHGLLPKEITTGDIQIMKKETGGALFYYPSGTNHALCIQEAAIENFRIQSNRDAAQRELTRWLRLSDADAQAHRDGLSAEGMEITGLKGWFVRRFASPEDFMKQSYRDQGVDQMAKLSGQGGGWMVITSTGESPADLIDAGRRFQRMALMARELNIGIHPMTQMIEEKHGMDQFARYHELGIIPQFILRVGYVASYPDPVSLRRPVEWFFRSA